MSNHLRNAYNFLTSHTALLVALMALPTLLHRSRQLISSGISNLHRVRSTLRHRVLCQLRIHILRGIRDNNRLLLSISCIVNHTWRGLRAHHIRILTHGILRMSTRRLSIHRSGVIYHRRTTEIGSDWGWVTRIVISSNQCRCICTHSSPVENVATYMETNHTVQNKYDTGTALGLSCTSQLYI